MKEYRDYLIQKAHTEDYDVFLVCIGHEGLMAYLDQVEEEPLIKEGSGVLLVDQLLITGNGKNRFMTIPFEKGELFINKAEQIDPDETYRKKSAGHLRERLHLLENSILMDHEIEHISNGQHI